MLESAIGFEHLVGETITTTPTHPFYVPKKGWTEAAKLRAGDILVTCNGEYVVVELVQHELLETPITVYNFEVEDFHTYYVAANEDAAFVLVHNSCKRDYQTNQTRQETIKFGSEREARSFARTKVGHNPTVSDAGKLVSRNGRWQYRAKPVDLAGKHIHLERLNPKTGEVKINYHLTWD